jgi:pseudouridine kinase
MPKKLFEFNRHPEGQVLVIGAAGVDIIGRLRTDLEPRTSSPGIIRTSFGGVARNVAENLARLGQPVSLISVVGQDENGDQLLENTRTAGVNIDAVLHSSQYPTGTYLAIINIDGEMQYGLDDMRVISGLTPEYIQSVEGLFDQAALIFLDMNIAKDTLRKVMTFARRKRIPVCADPTSQTLAGKLKPYLSQLWMIVPNSREAAILCERTFNQSNRREAAEAAQCLVSQGVEIAIIGLAAFGVVYATSETSGHVPAIRTPVIDPTGVGDALTATVIYSLVNDISLDDAIRLGVTAASLTLRHRGAVLPDLSLEKLYDQLVI